MTKSALKKAIKKGCLKVNGQIASTATWVKTGDELEFTRVFTNTSAKQFEFSLHVLFEDEHIAAIHKPSGILVSGNNFRTIARALPFNLAKSKERDACIPQPVHRLDFNTTGILLIGKTQKSIRLLNKAFEEKKISKKYLAITIGKMQSEGLVEPPIDGKFARTSFKVIDTVASEKYNVLNWVELKPLTGRRHQLRKHMSQIGNPILGDKDYGKEGLIASSNGMYLHAQELVFNHPITNALIQLSDPAPKKFTKIFR